MKTLEQLLEQAIKEKNVTALSNLKDFALHLQSYEIAANIRDYIKKLTPLFTSEDGIDIFEGDEFTLVVFYENKWFKYKRFKTTKFVEPKNDDLKKFADDLKALEWIELQKPKSITIELFTLQVNAICNTDKVTIQDLDEEFSVVISKEKLAEINKAMEELNNV